MALKRVLGENRICNASTLEIFPVTRRSSTMTLKFAAIVALAALALSLSACPRRASINVDEAKADGLKTANQWLGLIDAGDYAKAWSETAPGFRKEMSESEWTRGLEGYRKPMGKMLERKVADEQYANKLSDSPASAWGNYVVVRYRSRFEHKNSANETVLTMLEGGRWVVAGYFIN